jgi:cyclopropane-fatty-acyl-phospholipid synthase
MAAPFAPALSALHLPLRIELPGATPVDLAPNPGVTLRVLDPGLLQQRPGLDDLAVAYVDSRLEMDGSLLQGVGLAARLGQAIVRPQDRPHDASLTCDSGLGAYAERGLPTDFFRLWLDAELVASCARFESGLESLAAAQLASLRAICRKLRLQRGDRLLDADCGWGALARVAAREFGVQVLALAQSEAQLAVARARVRAERLEHRVQVALAAPGMLPSDRRFDRIVSIGLSGQANLPAFCRQLGSCLRPGGFFLGHFVTARRSGPGVQRLAGATEFIRRHVFPSGAIPAFADVRGALRPADLDLLQAQNLRLQLARTLECWSANLDRHLRQARHMVPERQLRQWRLHLAGGAYAFRHGWLQMHELVAAKPQEVVAGEH